MTNQARFHRFVSAGIQHVVPGGDVLVVFRRQLPLDVFGHLELPLVPRRDQVQLITAAVEKRLVGQILRYLRLVLLHGLGASPKLLNKQLITD